MTQPGIKDVAAHAKVSVGTVSNYLNRPQTVSEAMRARVESSIAALGFIRNETARQLRAGHSRLIGYVLLDLANPFFADVARGIEAAATDAGLALMLCDSRQDEQREGEYLDLLLQQRVRGVLLTPVDPDAAQVSRLLAHQVPVVLLDGYRTSEQLTCSVGVDDVEGGFLAVAHLLELGHRRIAVAAGPDRISQVRDRREGARRAVVEAGLSPAEVLHDLPTGDLTVAEGRRAGERLLGLPAARRPTAVFCLNDLLALGVLQTLTLRGVGVPDDVAIVGYDDIEFAEAAAVPLTSVRQPRFALGHTATELLLRDVAQDPGHVHEHVTFTPELVVRTSSRRRA